MATVSKAIADKIIANNGYYADDERVMQVVRYINFAGNEAYAILYQRDVDADRYSETEYVLNPRLVWEAKDDGR